MKFNSNKSFDTTYFSNYIKSVTQKFDNKFLVIQKNGCFKIKFETPKRKYLDFLTYYENAPTVRRTQNIEDGLGEFYVDVLNSELIVLKRKRRIKNAYEIIVGKRYNEQDNLNCGFYDFNLIAPFSRPEWVEEKYQKVENVELKTVVLIINHSDKNLRKLIYDCIDIYKLRSSFYPKKKDFIDVKSILPMGVYLPGKEFPKQDCKVKDISYPELIFANWMSDNEEQMNTFVSNFYKKTGVKIKVRKITPEVLVKNFDESKKIYNLTIVVIGAAKNDPITFLEPFFYKRRFYDYSVVKKIMKPENSKYIDDYTELINVLKKEFLVLPLYQSINQLYYPPHIKNIIVGRDFLQYPEIAEFRW